MDEKKKSAEKPSLHTVKVGDSEDDFKNSSHEELKRRGQLPKHDEEIGGG